jgi:hypothetical protein
MEVASLYERIKTDRLTERRHTMTLRGRCDAGGLFPPIPPEIYRFWPPAVEAESRTAKKVRA